METKDFFPSLLHIFMKYKEVFSGNSSSLKYRYHIQFSSLKPFWNSHFLSKDPINPLDLMSSELLVI